MLSLQNQLLTLWIALSCVTRAERLIQVSGYEGREVSVSCPYGKGYQSHEKYLCRNPCGYIDVLISTKGTKTEKYSIHDHKSRQVFTTTVSNLRLTDAGKYWCGVTRDGLDIYTEVKLEVEKDVCCDIFTSFQRHKEDSVSFICSYDSEHQNNLKYVCRGNQTSTCLRQAVVTSDSPQNGMFTLQDDKESRQFNVTIALLTQEDSGWYLCGVQMNRHGQSRFSAVEVKVKGLQREVNPENIDQQTSLLWLIKQVVFSNPAVFIVVAMLFAVLLVLVIVCAYRKHASTRMCVDVNASGASLAPPGGVENVNKGEPAEVMTGEKIYMNEDLAHSKQGTSKPLIACVHHEAADEDECDAVYQNVSKVEDIYCNQSYIKVKRR